MDRIEDAAIGEMDLLGFLPAAEDFVDGKEVHLGELSSILGCGLGIARAEVLVGLTTVDATRL